MLSEDSIKSGEIDTLAFGGDGIVREENRFVVFIPFTAPQEKILYRLKQIKKSYAYGQLAEVLDPHPLRITPKCPYFTQCGGCQLQHLAYPFHLAYKKQMVQEKLTTVFGPFLNIKIEEPKKIWEYREYISLTIKGLSSGYEVGYVDYDQQSLVAVKNCPIFNGSNSPIFQIIREICQTWPLLVGLKGKVTLIKRTQNTYLVIFYLDRKLTLNQPLKKLLSIYPEIQAIKIKAPKQNLTVGELFFKEILDDFLITYHPEAFMQTYQAESLEIYRLIRQKVADIKPKQLLDLYCGIGITSVFCSSLTHKIYAIELNSLAVQLAEKNALENRCHNIFFHQGRVEDQLKKFINFSEIELAIVNPPREGLDKLAMEHLSNSRIKDLFYISCNPATLIRDLKFFQEKAFNLEYVQVFDLFPQTSHMETFVHLKR